MSIFDYENIRVYLREVVDTGFARLISPNGKIFDVERPLSHAEVIKKNRDEFGIGFQPDKLETELVAEKGGVVVTGDRDTIFFVSDFYKNQTFNSMKEIIKNQKDAELIWVERGLDKETFSRDEFLKFSFNEFKMRFN